jgi:hypothetical protein
MLRINFTQKFLYYITLVLSERITVPEEEVFNEEIEEIDYGMYFIEKGQVNIFIKRCSTNLATLSVVIKKIFKTLYLEFTGLIPLKLNLFGVCHFTGILFIYKKKYVNYFGFPKHLCILNINHCCRVRLNFFNSNPKDY